MKRFNLLGINVDSIDSNEVFETIHKLSNKNKPSHIILLDTSLLIKALFNKKLRASINSAALVIPISYGIKRGLKLFKMEPVEVYNFFHFGIRLLAYFTDKEEFIYTLGGKKKNIVKIEKHIKDSFPGIRLVGRYHINYKKSFEKDLITAMQKASPSLVILGFRNRKQIEWIHNKLPLFKKGVFIGIEKFFDIIIGKEKVPTDKEIKSGFYGFKRALKNPFRFFRFFKYVVYGFLLLIWKIFGLYKK